jgi:predicted Zn-ribbon and HTH transcriptional regulator
MKDKPLAECCKRCGYPEDGDRPVSPSMCPRMFDETCHKRRAQAQEAGHGD